MLTSILLENWRSHAKTELKLTEGTNIFLGQMGSGKSSIMDALCFCLYGTYPKLGRRDVKLEDVRNFRHPKSEVVVEVEWEEEKRKFKARRELISANAWLYIDGKLHSKGPKAVSDEVERILQIPYELFARAVYAEQNKLDYWLSISAGNRKTELDRLLGLDRFEIARAGATAEINRLKEKAGGIEREISERDIAGEREKAKEGKEKIEMQKGEINRIKKEAAEVQVEFEKEKKEFEKMENEYKRHNELSAKMQKLEGMIFSVEKNIEEGKNLPKIGEMEKRREEIGKEKMEIERRIKEMEQKEHELALVLGKLNASIKNEKENAHKFFEFEARQKNILQKRSLETIRTELAGTQNDLQKMVSLKATMESQLEDVKKVLEALKVHAKEGEGHECPVCGQGLEEKKRKMLEEENAKRKSLLEKEILKNKDETVNARKAVETLSKIDAEASRLEAQMQAHAPKADAIKMEKETERELMKLEGMKKEKAQKNAELKIILQRENEVKGFVEKIMQTEKYKVQEENLKKEKEGMKVLMQGISFSQDEYKRIGKKCEEAGMKKAGLEEKEKGAEALLQNMHRMQNEIEKSLLLLERKKEEGEKIRKEIGELECFKSVLLATQAQVRGRLIEGINSAMQKLWTIIYPYGDWGGARIVAGEKDYSVQIFQGEWKELEAHASGGERACLGLCLRASLSILLTPQLGWLILDEPTHNLDSQAVSSLGNALSEKMPKIIPQIIVITHEPMLSI